MKECLSSGTGGAMYIAGTPGTGKTSMLQNILDDPEYVQAPFLMTYNNRHHLSPSFVIVVSL